VLRFSKICPVSITSVLLTLVGTLPLVLAFPVWPQTYVGKNPHVIVSVFDDARLPAAVLAQAEAKAAKIFGRAGVDMTWANCSTSPQREAPDALIRAGAPVPTWSGLVTEESCVRFDWPKHLALRIVAQSVGSPNEVFGMAFLSTEGLGCYSDVFYDNAMELHTAWNVGLGDILGSVMAHELGHLILGSNSHSPTGIMRARWEHGELRRLERGSLVFTDEQAERMRVKVIVAPPAGQPDLAVTAQSRF